MKWEAIGATFGLIVGLVVLLACGWLPLPEDIEGKSHHSYFTGIGDCQPKPVPTCEPVVIRPQIQPCPACPEPTPAGEPFPRYKDQTAESPESAFYRGWLAGCLKSGQDNELPEDAVIRVCLLFMNRAIDEGIYDFLTLDGWEWPIEEEEEDEDLTGTSI